MTVPQAFALALAHHQGGRLAEAEQLYRQILAVVPQHADALHSLGQLAFQTGRHDVGLEWMRQSIAINPRNAIYHDNLGTALRELGQVEEAIACSQRALALEPGEAVSHNNLGNLYKDQGRIEDALGCYERALTLAPDYAEAENNRGVALKDLGGLDEAIQAHRRARELQPDWADAHSNLLLALHYPPDLPPEEISAEHRRWDELHAKPFLAKRHAHSNDPAPDRRLRIGLVSPDFREHAVAFFIEGWLARHDRTLFELICYQTAPRPDAVTTRLQSYVAEWHHLAGLTDAQAGELIRRDGIDILVDLAGHTSDHRLLVFASQPAPVQVTWLGYCDTTGMHAMQYRITDAHADPPGMTEHLHTEALIRLPECAWCFRPHDDTPPVGAPPVARSGRVTFGCFNTMPKITDPMLALWSSILRDVPDSRLLLKNFALNEPSARARITARLAAAGIAAARVELRGSTPSIAAHLATYASVDIAFDTFPYHGTTTTCEALWMGVPVVTLAGRTHASRVGVSLLTNAALPELIAKNEDDYRRIAVQLATDPARLSALRSSMRVRLAGSPLTDASRFARNLEAALRDRWRRWCAEYSAAGAR